MRTIRRLTVWFASALLAAGCAQSPSRTGGTAAAAAPRPLFDLPHLVRELPNGLRVVIVRTDYPDIVTIQIPVQTGSRNEVEAGKSGFAHFFEHMMFRGTEKYPADAYGAIIKNAGADQNAYTSDDLTNYHTTFIKSDLEKIIEIEADRFQNLKYTEEQFRTEALAVKGEYLKNSANPIQKLFEVTRDLAFTTHTYKHTTIGFARDIDDMPNQLEYSKVFFERWYRPEYTTVIIAGDVDLERTAALVEKYWGKWRRGHYTLEIPQEPAPQGPKYAHVHWESPTQPWVWVSFHGPRFEAHDKAMPAMELVAEVYFAETSDLYQQLVVKEQKADQLFAYFPRRKDPYLLTVGARLNRAEDARYVTDAILATFARARTEAVPEKKLADIKANLKYGFIGRLDNSEAVGATLASFAHFERAPIATINTLARTYELLTPDDLRHYANIYFTDARRVVTTLASAPALAGMDALPSVDELATSAAARPPAGIAFTELRSTSPLVDVAFLFNVGAAWDPPGKKGLAALTAAMVAEGGSRERTIRELTDARYPMAAGFSWQIDKEMTRFAGTVHRDNLDAWYRLAAEQLLSPGWREEDFKRLKTQLINAIRTNLRGNNDEELGKEVLYSFIYGPQHPYGSYSLGALEDLAAITLEDVKAFYATHYTPASLTVGLAGGYDDAFKARVATDMARLPASSGLAVALPAPAAFKGRHALIVRKDTQPVAVSFGFPIAVRRGDPDWVALWLVRSYLGEHRSSTAHLYQRIREARGMNYGDYAYIEYFPRGMFQFMPDANLARRQHVFEIWLRPLRNNNDAVFATRVALYELEKLVREGMRREDFEATRNYLDKFVAQMVSTQSLQLGYALDSRWYGIPPFVQYVREGLAKLTLEDVNRVIRTHLKLDDIKFVFVSRDAEDLRKRLVSDMPSPIAYEVQQPEALLAEDRIIEKLPLGFAAESVRIVPLEEIFARGEAP
ncbi:MAG TPA: pitrilysin family protein [Gammaproteobacteria bacterium]|nr:pitrilysin family protein [Gammaproteobacteria bacterium]